MTEDRKPSNDKQIKNSTVQSEEQGPEDMARANQPVKNQGTDTNLASHEQQVSATGKTETEHRASTKFSENLDVKEDEPEKSEDPENTGDTTNAFESKEPEWIEEEITRADLREDLEERLEFLAHSEELFVKIERRLKSLENKLNKEISNDLYDKVHSRLQSEIERHRDTVDNLLASAFSDFGLDLVFDEIQDISDRVRADILFNSPFLDDQVRFILHRLNSLEAHFFDNESKKEVEEIQLTVTEANARSENIFKETLTFKNMETQIIDTLESRDLFIKKNSITATLDALELRRIIVFKGPPGCGKTHFARALTEIIHSSHRPMCLTEITLGPEITSYDVIGGMKMKKGDMIPHLGCLSTAIIESIKTDGRHWLLLDEINRGNISEILSPSLGALDMGPSKLHHPFLFPDLPQSSGKIPIPGDFRILGTMNSFDEDQLFKFSQALNRRIAFVEIGHPERKAEKALIEKLLENERKLHRSSSSLAQFKRELRLEEATALILDTLDKLRDISQRPPARDFQVCDLGTKTLVDIIKYVSKTRLARRPVRRNNWRLIVDSAFASFVLAEMPLKGFEVLRALEEEVFTPKARFPECNEKIRRMRTQSFAY